MPNKIDTEMLQSMTAVLHDIHESMSGEVAAIRSQTDQVGSLLKDAIASLHESFASIHEASDQQMQSMTALMMDVSGTHEDKNIFQKAERSSAILTDLINTLLLSSKNNLHALTTMDAVHKRLKAMIGMEKEQERLIAQLCECSAAEDMDVEKVRWIGQQLRDTQQEQVEYVSTTMTQFKKTHQLIDTIASKDLEEVFSAKEKVEDILQHFFQINEIITASRVQVNQVNAEMRQHLGAVIRALQFEDITSQSLSHTDRHLGRMSGMVAILTDGLKAMDQSDISVETYVSHIVAIHIAMSEYHQQLQLENSNPVSQDSMDEGDVDLF